MAPLHASVIVARKIAHVFNIPYKEHVMKKKILFVLPGRTASPTGPGTEH